jgi:hypothetical protein
MKVVMCVGSHPLSRKRPTEDCAMAFALWLLVVAVCGWLGINSLLIAVVVVHWWLSVRRPEQFKRDLERKNVLRFPLRPNNLRC